MEGVSQSNSLGYSLINDFQKESVLEIKELTTPAELELGYVVLKELRTELGFQEFQVLYCSAREHDGYTLVGVCEGEVLAAVMGYRVLYDFVHGKHLYIDDLVVTERFRSRGIGAKLLRYSEKVAAQLDCKGLRLCTGVENEAGKRFYEREGWKPRALAYKKRVES